ncbi:hypothetical protein LTR53_016326, partial [Teratosphaeriaceae sp. CCFEE 6253]
ILSSAVSAFQLLPITRKMLPQSLFGLATLVMAVVAIPTDPSVKTVYTCACPLATTSSLASAKSTKTAKSSSSAVSTSTASTKAATTSSTISTKASSTISTKASSTISTKASSTSSSAAATSTANNGQQFLNKCTNFGISVADCSQFLNIAALNGNSVAVGGTSAPPAGAVNNGQQFVNKCNNVGVSILDCAQLLNVAILNGNSIDISLTDLTSLLTSLGLPTSLASILPVSAAGLVSLPSTVL